jgi:integrase
MEATATAPSETIKHELQNRMGIFIGRRRDERVFQLIELKHSWPTACKRAGIVGLRFHDLRATAITRMLQTGVPAQVVMRISGHTQPTTFLRDARAGAEEIQDVAS